MVNNVHIDNVKEIYCDSGRIQDESLYCDIDGRLYVGIEQITLNDIGSITVKKNDENMIRMQFNKKFKKPTECIVKNNKIVTCITHLKRNLKQKSIMGY